MAQAQIQGGKSYLKWAVPALVLMGLCLWLTHIFLDSTIPVWAYTHLRSSIGGPWYEAVKELGQIQVPLWLFFLMAGVGSRKRIAIEGFAALAFMGISVIVFKFIFGRLRPAYELGTRHVSEIRAWDFGQYSFPSGDTTCAFAAAVVFAVVLPKAWKWIPYTIAAVVAVLRVLSVHHYPTDIVAGMFLGVGCGVSALRLVERYLRRIPMSLWYRPRLYLAILLLFPLTDLFSDHGEGPFFSFFVCFGPILVAILLIAKSDFWLHRLASEDQTGFQQGKRICLVALLLCALSVLPNLPWTTFYDRDEGYYAGCAREMILRGDPFVPHFNGEPWLEKPPLTIWMMALSMKVFGQNEFAARLPSALAGLLAVWMTYSLARRMYTLTAGVLAGVILGTSLLFAGAMRLALLDTTLVCTLLLAMIGFWDFLETRSRKGRLLFYIGCGLGVLAKGPLGFVLPVISACGFVLLSRQWQILKELRPVSGFLITAAVVGIWAGPALWITHGAYFHELVWVRTLEPILSPLQGHGGGNWIAYFLLLPVYIPALFVGMIPWSIFFVPALRNGILKDRSENRAAFLGGWIIPQFLAFSLVSTKLPHYMLPLFPALAIVLGAFLGESIRNGDALIRRLGSKSQTSFIVGGAILAAVILGAPAGLGFLHETPWFLPAALVVALGTIRGIRLLRGNRDHRAMGELAAVTVLCFALLCSVALPRLDKAKSARQVAAFLKEYYGEKSLSQARIGMRRYQEVSFPFYLGQHVTKLSDTQEMEQFLRQEGPASVVLPEKYLERSVGEGLSVPYEVLWEKRVWIPEKAEWLDLVIIGN
ncbi:MAG TPA: glycosyltransferase family 39 protein [bacterium]|nr:glycosyltransferase family 39 protein [bacterium]HQL63871.1 glycosyltransferase family 39 protein [bacterium]